MRDQYFNETGLLLGTTVSVVGELHRNPEGALLTSAFLNDRFVSGGLRLSEERAQPRQQLRYGPLTLLEHWIPLAGLAPFLSDLAEGRASLEGAAIPRTAGGGHLGRELSNTISGWPEWQVRFQIERSPQRSGIESELAHDALVAFGSPPYMNSFHAINEWVFGDLRSWSATNVRTDELTVWIPDTRARFTRTVWEPGRVRLHIQSHVAPSAVQAQLRFLGSRGARVAVLPAAELLEHEVPDDAESVVAFLVHERGDLLATANLGRWAQSPPVQSDEQLTVAQRAEKDIADGEGQYVEFKEFVKLKEQKEAELERTIVAFANAGGGRLYLGVRDDRTLQGSAAAKEAAKEPDVEKAVAALARRLESEIANWIKPEKPLIVINRIDLAGNAILSVHVDAGEQAYSTSDETICVRRGATSAKASIADIRELFERARGKAQVTSRQALGVR